MTTPTLVRAIESAAAAREGVNLLSYTCSGLINLKASDPTILSDVDLLKVGTFNGWTFSASDLEACVEHFSALTEGGIFTPPVRLDHSWSILQVVGYIDALRTAVDVDRSTGQPTTFLRGDLRITEPLALDLIKRGTAVNRSSELGPYETNSGVLYPLICYGVAFVDIPAVEGLRPIELSRRYGSPRTVISLTDERARPMDTTTTPAAGATATTPATGAPAATEPAAGGSTATTPAAAAPSTKPAAEPAAASTPATAEPTATAPAERETDAERELREIREERAQMRAEVRDNDLARFRERGIVVQGNEAHASTLLGHDDKAVRDAARSLLGSLKPPVELGKTVGALSGGGASSGSPAATTQGGEITLSAEQTPEEVGKWWAELAPEQRKAGTPEHNAFTKWRQDRAASK